MLRIVSLVLVAGSDLIPANQLYPGVVAEGGFREVVSCNFVICSSIPDQVHHLDRVAINYLSVNL
jgi:hypothetical protein